MQNAKSRQVKCVTCNVFYDSDKMSIEHHKTITNTKIKNT